MRNTVLSSQIDFGATCCFHLNTEAPRYFKRPFACIKVHGVACQKTVTYFIIIIIIIIIIREPVTLTLQNVRPLLDVRISAVETHRFATTEWTVFILKDEAV